MRFLLALLGFLALATAPFAAPATAMAARDVKCEVRSTMPHGQAHKSGDHQAGVHAACCMMVPAALPPATGVGDGPMVLTVYVLSAVPFLSGIVVDGDDPPPRAV
jgi:hypothetical protein